MCMLAQGGLPAGDMPEDESVLEALAKACRPGRGHGMCRRAVLLLRAACLLDISPAQVAALSALDALLLLLNASSAACEVTKNVLPPKGCCCDVGLLV